MRTPPPAVQGAIRMTGGGGRAQIDRMAAWVGEHARPGVPIHAEFMKFGRGGVSDAFRAAMAAGSPVSVLADESQLKFGSLPGLARDGAELVVYGLEGRDSQYQRAYVQHGKGISTPTHAVVATIHPSKSGKHQLNLMFEVEGEAAAALHEATAASLRQSGKPEQAAALDRARRAGIILNDPEVGRAAIDETYHQLIAGADRRIDLVTKEFFDPRYAEHLADRKSEGIDTRVLTREIDPKSAEILRKAGISQREVPFSATPVLNSFLGRRLHFNVVAADVDGTSTNPAADGAAAISSRYLWMPSKLDGSETLARELGLVVAGGDAQRAMELVEDHVGRSHMQVLKARLLGT